jgi:hypothetical protein
MRPQRRWIVLAVSAAVAAAAVAQEAPAPTTAERARALGEEGRWGEAAAAWEEVVATDASDGGAWFELGSALLRAGDPAGALAAFERARPAGGPAYLLPLRRAIAAAALGRPEVALAGLAAAREAGLPPGVLAQHEGLAEVRRALSDDPGFQALLADDERRAHPCRHDPAYRELDFWVGEWEVVAGGTTIGHNRIEKVLDGCAVLEHWSGAGGGEGKSLNVRHPVSGRWRQLWMAASGGTVDYEGGLDADGAMRLEGGQATADGATALVRMALVPLADGRVRQLIEQSPDGGTTWEVRFDATYRRVAAAAQTIE